jgi:hypothetical protein
MCIVQKERRIGELVLILKFPVSTLAFIASWSCFVRGCKRVWYGTDINDGCIVVPQPMGTPTHTRRKDRISYSHEEFSIDLTQVTSTASGGGVVRPHPAPSSSYPFL